MLLGAESKRRLPLLKQEKIAMQDFGKPDRVLMFKYVDNIEHPVDHLSLVSTTGDTERRLLAYQKSLVDALLLNFGKRLNIPVSLYC